MISILLVCFLVLRAVDLSVSACCVDKLGCFNNEGDFSHMYKPYCMAATNPQFVIYTSANKKKPWGRNDPIPEGSLDVNLRTIFIIHGFGHKLQSDWLGKMKNELLAKERANFVVVGWGGATDRAWIKYAYAAHSARLLGAELAFRINRLKKEAGMSSNLIWCIGHGLGAHVCGFAGKKTALMRITGLDPAGKYFDHSARARLNGTDAVFVDVIHTAYIKPTLHASWGSPIPMGTVDFYPNLGQDQMPGCGSTYTRCSHDRVLEYFKISIRRTQCFRNVRKCEKSIADKNKCKICTDCGVMGYNADQLDNGTRLEGIYYLETGDRVPYCNGDTRVQRSNTLY